MLMEKITKDFYLHEFIDRATYHKYGESSIWFIDPKIITLAQFLRNHFHAPMTINNWFWGGHYQFSGFRPKVCEVGGDLSQHRFGRGIDVKIKGITPTAIREEIRKNFAIFAKHGLTTIEKNTPTWTHLDCRTVRSGKLFEVNP